MFRSTRMGGLSDSIVNNVIFNDDGHLFTFLYFYSLYKLIY